MTAKNASNKETSGFTILVCSCDAYEECWDPFFLLMERYWPEAKNVPIILNTETKVFQKEGWDIRCFQFYKGRKAPSFGTRMLRHLKQVRTPLVFLMLDDFFLRAPVDHSCVEGYVNAMLKDPDISTFNFTRMNERGFPSETFPEFQEYYPIAFYRLNMHIALWRTKVLKRTWKPGATPWSWETFAPRRTECTKKKFYFLQENKDLLFDIGNQRGLCWGRVQGQWHHDDMVPFFEKEGIDFDFERLGWFDYDAFIQQEKEEQSRITKTQKLWIFLTELYLGGFKFSCRRLRYAFAKCLFRLNKSYDEYMRGRYNPAEPNPSVGEEGDSRS